MPNGVELEELRQQEYDTRAVVDRLRREVFSQGDPSASAELEQQLIAAEKELHQIESAISKLLQNDPDAGLILDNEKNTGLLGADTTGLEARLELRMEHFPTSTSHLLDAARDPLFSCSVRNARNNTRRLRVSSYIDGYSAWSVDTVELEGRKSHTFQQLPTLFPEKIRQLDELTRATLNVQVEDLDGTLELHKTHPVWLLAKTTAPLAVKDPSTGKWRDLTRYLGAYVTPNSPAVMTFLRSAVEHHPEKRLFGYQGKEENADQIVTPQVAALFKALKEDADITYVNSVVDFSPAGGSANQRVRLPAESLADKQANCLDGTVLFSSLLEGISMNPGIVLIPGHAFVAWESWKKSGQWKYLETTMIRTHSFEEACASAENSAANRKALANALQDENQFRFWSLRDLRSQHQIFPMA